MTDTDWNAVNIINPQGQGGWLLVCEHASRRIPDALGGLGLSSAAGGSHAAWDIGALDVAHALSDALDAPLVAGDISRLVYDCNRPITAPDCVPARSEVYDIPGNAGLDDARRQQRYDQVHTPFHDAVTKVRTSWKPTQAAPVLVTIHSFTPVYNGATRAVELGFLYHAQPAAAQALLAVEQARGRYASALNEPYAATDGVTYTLEKHGEAQALPAVMIEIRNDLIDTPEKAQAMAGHLAESLTRAFPAPNSEAAR
ncbi:MAG: N-formylglutamate amidohydrolase [Sulfitobacter litoralis]|mgnify:FL=1|uniref:N-formylglutamate amidohydrolase n=2 Tax=root TaxID=1 RepID=A0A1H0IVZ4_9RHOB|nr:N-formylglutamate amidohydrolase [Sulfitobacter litoralis]MCF7727987.1 N-formylglutamate amidohydrolase [Sulfitobacter sp. M22]MCF7776466.1 N-formylglutamate amidohydrolase [Sulfitobacter sp. M220]MBQ0715887.1 N-formylglutamate amidohydrolase [Sulfitobacter litoralis]MBQ0765387.1 N-formylglutamate amidohydrolase [Sulfitobacter litoralis]MBQ0802534.1 N-formylglutamate amidohydrolase [Sulfitobacter litoralis]